MATSKFLRVVLDTNIFLSAYLTKSSKSINKKIIDKWIASDFLLLYSTDILFEYERKLTEHKISDEDIEEIFANILLFGEDIFIKYFHFPIYPVDEDDIKFLLCAFNGRASHIVTFDRHLLKITNFYKNMIKICKPPEFINDLNR